MDKDKLVEATCAGCGKPITWEHQVDALGRKCGRMVRAIYNGDRLWFHGMACFDKWESSLND